jgi:TetR/AcrR family transcriptional regulator, copper-responsive repressor
MWGNTGRRLRDVATTNAPILAQRNCSTEDSALCRRTSRRVEVGYAISLSRSPLRLHPMYMGRPKGFTREEVLLKAIALFWEKGLSDTTLQDLERATGVNKSGLYTEFRDKEDIFVESLRHYLNTRGGDDILSMEPKGWNNIQRFLEIGHTCYSGRRGCFSVNSLRDASRLPPEALKIVDENNAKLKRLITRNIKAELPQITNPGLLTDVIFTFFAGLCIEQNSEVSLAASKKAIARFMTFLAHAH